MLEVSHVSKKYRGCQQALEDVSLSVGPGEIVGIFGPNGAGKTTLLKCILGLLRYGFGSVTLDGQPITPKNIARLSFATCEHSFFPGLTAAGHRDFCAEHFPAFRAGRFQMLMDFFRLPEKRALRGFSTGQKNQFEVILACAQGADYILMDEPFAGNDVFNREDFYKVLLGILEPTEAILLSTHLLEEVQHFISRAVLLRSGRIAGDVTTAALEERSQSLMDYVRSPAAMSPAGCSRRWSGWTAEGRNSHAEISAALSPPGRSVRRPAGGGLRRRAGPPGDGILPDGATGRRSHGRRRCGAHLGVHLRLSPVLAQHLSRRRAGGGRNPLFLLRPEAELDH